MLDVNISIIDFLPPLGFFVLNVFVPGPNVLNTIAISMGSGRSSGVACALACGLGLLISGLVALFGATLLFYKIPIIYAGLTVFGGVMLLYFAQRYIRKSLSSSAKLIALQDIDKNIAFQQAFLVVMSNPKVMTTWLAVISLFPFIASNAYNAFIFSTMAGMASFIGHFIFATVFSTSLASQIYMQLYKPINGIVGIGFVIYGMKLFLSLV
jgi:threonine/homoserine/homoserine lactone efflux protein